MKKWTGIVLAAMLIMLVAGCTTTSAPEPSTGFERVETDNIFSVMYLEDFGTLMVIETGGNGFEYADVPDKVYQNFMTSENKDAFYEKQIKGKYEQTKF